MNAKSSEVLFEKYNPEVGLRTASILGSMLMLIIVYLLWRSKCKCKLKTNGDEESEEEYDMEYWLNHVDRQKLEQKNYYHTMFNPTLPEACSNSKQATAAWIIEHRKIWTNMHKHDFKSFTASTPTHLNRKIKGSKTKQSSGKKNQKGGLFRQINFINNLKQMTLLKGVARVNSNQSRNKAQMLTDLDCKTQLLIDYARIDAITNNTFNKLHLFNNNNASLNTNSSDIKQSSFKTVSIYKNKQYDIVSDIEMQETKALNDEVNSSSGVDNYDSLNNKKQKLRLTEKLIKNSFRRRSYSWPKCKYDNRSHMSNYERLIKLNCLKLIYSRHLNDNSCRTALEPNSSDSLKQSSIMKITDDFGIHPSN